MYAFSFLSQRYWLVHASCPGTFNSSWLLLFRPLGVSKVAGRSDGPQFFVDVTWRDGVQQSLTVWTEVRVKVNVEGVLPKTSFQVRTDVVSHRYTIEVASLSPLIFHIDSNIIIHMTSRIQACLQITLQPPGS